MSGTGSYHLTKEELKNIEHSTTNFISPHEREAGGQTSSESNAGTRATAKDSGPTDAGKQQQQQSHQKGGTGQQQKGGTGQQQGKGGSAGRNL